MFHMPKLHLFYPENDLALALDVERYTAPSAAVRLRRAGATLPLLYGDAGDKVLTQGVDARWLGRLRDSFGIGVRLFDGVCRGLTAAPWGWSKASRRYFSDLGFSVDNLPNDATLAKIRSLSHRRTAAYVAAKLAERLPFAVAPAAIECIDEAQVKTFVMSHPEGTVLKLPWSSSGRGLVATDSSLIDAQMPMVRGMLRRQASVMAEPRYNKIRDFAMLFTLDAGQCRFDGYSVFRTEQLGSYAGNVLASQEALAAGLYALCPQTQLEAVRDALCAIIEEVAGDAYEGPLGVDMMLVDNPGYMLAPVVEINFRMTMGHLCRIFYSRYVAAGAEGTFSVFPKVSEGRFDADVFNGRIRGGTVDLAQPGSDFSFLAEF